MFRNVIRLIGVQDPSTLAVNGMEYELDECLVLEFIGYGLFYILGAYLSLEIRRPFSIQTGSCVFHLFIEINIIRISQPGFVYST